jgi:hypothetical protein
MNRTLTDEEITLIVNQFEAVLRSGSDVVVNVEAGFIRRGNHRTGYMEAEPTGGKTITITINGGGGMRDESPEESYQRMMASLASGESDQA